MSYQYRYKSWNWNRTFTGVFKISLLVFGFSIVFQNLSFLNSIHPYIPVGLLMVIILGIAIIDHVYKVVKWYLAWTKHSYDNHKRIGNIIIHLCLYLIVIAIALSIPINFSSVQNIEKPVDDTLKSIGLREFTKEERVNRVQINNNDDKLTPIIKNVLLNTDNDTLKYIVSVNVVNQNVVADVCNNNIAIGCADISYSDDILSTADIYVSEVSEYGELCNTFAGTLYHEIGHVVFAKEYGYIHSMNIREEIYADNYAKNYVTEKC